MDQKNSVLYLTILLTFCAGFCDTATFVGANELFSAHVTGNFIVLAYDVVHGSDGSALMKLITFPVFMLSVMIGGRIIAKYGNRYTLLVIESLVLAAGGLTIWALVRFGMMNSEWSYVISMLMVFAMGLQNAFNKLFPNETYGPTTIMTGNVTQLALQLEQGFRLGFSDPALVAGLKKQSLVIGGFLTGCLAGGFLTQKGGLICIFIPGLLLLASSSRLHPAGNKA